jgi:hypothetical protein
VNIEGALAGPLVHRASGVSQLPPSTPTKPAGQSFHAHHTKATPSAPREDTSFSFTSAQPTGPFKEKKGPAHIDNPPLAAQAVNTDSSVPLNSTSQGDLDIVALHATPSTETVSGLESDLHSENCDTRPSPAPAPHPYHSNHGIAFDLGSDTLVFSHFGHKLSGGNSAWQ